VSIVLGDVNCGLEHQHREGNSWNPVGEANNVKYGEYNKDNGSPNAKQNLRYFGNPYDLFRKGSCHPKVCQTNEEGSCEYESTEIITNDLVGRDLTRV
jgi:hypothetical protein